MNVSIRLMIPQDKLEILQMMRVFYDSPAVEHTASNEILETGNVFIKDGKMYRIPKAYHQVQAQRSGLNYPPVNTNVPMQAKCRTCQRKNSCNGCHWCGKCK